MRTPLIHLLACPLLLVSGCSRDGPEMAPVHGVISFDGRPLSGFQHAAVVFTPKGGRPAKGVISPKDGSFDLSTYTPGDGARVGLHAVAVSATVDDPKAKTEEKYPGVRFIIPENLANRDTSGLDYEVKPGGNVIQIQLRPNGTGAIVTQ